jgi:hypothetical protein
MTLDKSAVDVDLSSIPGEFRENYRFLTEMISCDEKNRMAASGLETLVDRHLCRIRGSLNRRQISILNRFLEEAQVAEDLEPPVPVELEASIRIKKRVSWLPWEAEAIRKIDRWRKDVQCIVLQWTGAATVATHSSFDAPTARKSAQGSGINTQR